jgi:hypothetical protein
MHSSRSMVSYFLFPFIFNNSLTFHQHRGKPSWINLM